MDTINKKIIYVRIMSVVVILTMMLSVSSVTYATPVSADNRELSGDRINLSYGGWITFPSGEPFHIIHGWGVISDDGVVGVYDFQLEVDGINRTEDFKDFGSESGDIDVLQRIWVFNFPEGMDGEHTFTGHWYAPCQYAVDNLGYPGSCPTPNAKVETYTSTLTVNFNGDIPEMELRVNYGHDWVESFYQTGHNVIVTVTDPDGNIKATVNVVTVQKGDWGGEPGFQTGEVTWFDGEGNEMEFPPDIQPFDWVFAEVDNGVSAQVQIGDISGMIDFENNVILGTINAPWSSAGDPVTVECLPWGAPEPLDLINDVVLPNGEDEYSCTWETAWEFNLGQDIGVGYFSNDGHWVANVFYSYARIIASESGDWFWTTDFKPNEEVTVAIYDSRENGASLWEGTRTTDESGFIILGYDDHGIDLAPGYYLEISDASTLKGLVLEPIAIHTFNTLDDSISGTAPFNRDVLVGAGLQDFQYTLWVKANEVIDDPDKGGWSADFSEIVNITEEMRTWSWAQIFDRDWDANEGSNPPPPEIRVWLSSNRVDGYGWPVGDLISLYIDDFDNPIDTQTVTETEWGPLVSFNLMGIWDLEPGQEIWMIGGQTEKFHTILPVSITEVDAQDNIVSGTSRPGGRIILCVYDGGCDPPAEIFDDDEDGFWTMDYSGILNIFPGNGMDATEMDEDNDGTSFEYWVPRFVLPGSAQWLNSGIYLSEGTTMTIEAEGEVYTADWDTFPGAFSGPDGQLYYCPSEGNSSDCALNGAPYGALVAKIGEYGEPFLVGSNLTFTVSVSGELYFAVNDNLGFYDDNLGEYLIRIVEAL